MSKKIEIHIRRVILIIFSSTSNSNRSSSHRLLSHVPPSQSHPVILSPFHVGQFASIFNNVSNRNRNKNSSAAALFPHPSTQSQRSVRRKFKLPSAAAHNLRRLAHLKSATRHDAAQSSPIIQNAAPGQ